MNPPHPTRLSPAAAARAVWLLFGIGLAIGIVMLVRSQVGGDQLNLLARGWLLAAEGKWISYGNPMSTGGKAPGGITSILVGLPLFLWRDHRAASALVLVFHVLAYLILDATLKRTLSPFERVLLAVFYWLNPWRLYFGSFLWNPNYLFLFGVLHLWSARTQRERGRFWPSFVHAAGLALAFQIHASFLLLAVASALLWWRRYFRVSWPGFLLGGALASVPLVPWAMELASNPGIVTEASKGFLGRGLVLVFPLLRGLLYWLRYASLAIAGRMGDFNFGDFGPDPWLGPALRVLGQALAVTALLPLLANIRLWRRGKRLLREKLAPGITDRSWLKGYARVCFVAAVIVFSLSPTTLMMWQGLILFHAAILPVVLWLGPLSRTRFASRVATGTRVYVAAEILLGIAMALGSLQYRCAGHTGDDSFGFPLPYDHPMFHELKIQETCPWPIDPAKTWWPDVLPRPSS
ncbi:MAG: hypothetical protein ACJ75H_08370 [Thermoanaerobaculia bacterium]